MASLTQWTWIWTNSRRRWSLAYCNPWSCKEPDNSNNIPYLLPFGSIWDIWTCSVASLPLLESVLNQKWCRCGINCERSIFLAAPKPSVFFSWHGINPEWMIRLVFNLFGNFFFLFFFCNWHIVDLQCCVYLLINLWPCPAACGILVPPSGVKPASPLLEGGILTTGPPGKSPVFSLFSPSFPVQRQRVFCAWLNGFTSCII